MLVNSVFSFYDSTVNCQSSSLCDSYWCCAVTVNMLPSFNDYSFK